MQQVNGQQVMKGGRRAKSLSKSLSGQLVSEGCGAQQACPDLTGRQTEATEATAATRSSQYLVLFTRLQRRSNAMSTVDSFFTEHYFVYFMQVS